MKDWIRDSLLKKFYWGVLNFLLLCQPVILFAVPPMPGWVKSSGKGDYSRAPSGKSTDYRISIMDRHAVVAETVSHIYRPRCAYYLGCPSSESKEYGNWPETYLRRTDDQMSRFVKEDMKMARLRAVDKLLKQ